MDAKTARLGDVIVYLFELLELVGVHSSVLVVVLIIIVATYVTEDDQPSFTNCLPDDAWE